MAVNTFDYTAGNDPANKWDNEANAWDSTDGTEAYYDIPAKEDNENNRLEGITNNSSGSGTITKVELGVECRSENESNVHGRIRAVFNGTGGANNDSWDIPTTEATRWYDVTSDPNAPGTWTWTDIANLDIRFWAYNSKSYGARWVRADQLYVRITYSAGPSPGWNKLVYTSEPPTPNAWNQVKQEAGTGWKKLLYEGD